MASERTESRAKAEEGTVPETPREDGVEPEAWRVVLRYPGRQKPIIFTHLSEEAARDDFRWRCRLAPSSVVIELQRRPSFTTPRWETGK